EVVPAPETFGGLFFCCRPITTEARHDRALAGGHRSLGPSAGAPAEPAGAARPQNRAVETRRRIVGARAGPGARGAPSCSGRQPPHRRALLFFALVTACERPSPTGPASGGDQTAPETNPAFDVATSEPGSPLPFLTLAQRALFERGRGVFQTEFTPATGLGPLFN